ASRSGVTGTDTALATRATTASASSAVMRSPSPGPSDAPTAPLDVAMAGNPAAATRSADAASHTLGSTPGEPGTCSDRNLAAWLISAPTPGHPRRAPLRSTRQRRRLALHLAIACGPPSADEGAKRRPGLGASARLSSDTPSDHGEWCFDPAPRWQAESTKLCVRDPHRLPVPGAAR